jgi:hypothetical protein
VNIGSSLKRIRFDYCKRLKREKEEEEEAGDFHGASR